MRLLLSLLGGALATFALFLLMRSLIDVKGGRLEQAAQGGIVDFVRLRPDEIVARKERHRPEPPPPPPAKRPPPPALEVSEVEQLPPRALNIAMPDIKVPPAAGLGPYIGGFNPERGAAEGDVIPIVRIAPQYPREARLRGTEGWVKVHFTINEDGGVSDATVVEADPRRVFNREAVRAILRWKFKPRIVDGIAVKRDAEQVIEFTMDGG